MNYAQATYDRLDALSRTRALTEAESRSLARAIKLIDRQSTRKGSARGWTPELDRQFLAAIASGCKIGEAAEMIGKTRNAGCGRYRRLRDAGLITPDGKARP